MNKYLAIILTLFVLTFAAAGTALACSCMVEDIPVEAQITKSYDGAAAVFTGKVTRIEMTPAGLEVKVHIKVTKSWKGNVRGEIIVKTARDSSMCGYQFLKGKTYLVYASGSPKELGVSNCSRTALADKNNDIEYVGELARKKKSAKKQ